MTDHPKTVWDPIGCPFCNVGAPSPEGGSLATGRLWKCTSCGAVFNTTAHEIARAHRGRMIAAENIAATVRDAVAGWTPPEWRR